MHSTETESLTLVAVMMALSSCYGELSEVRVYKVSLGSLSPWLVPLIIMKAETWEDTPSVQRRPLWPFSNLLRTSSPFTAMDGYSVVNCVLKKSRINHLGPYCRFFVLFAIGQTRIQDFLVLVTIGLTQAPCLRYVTCEGRRRLDCFPLLP